MSGLFMGDKGGKSPEKARRYGARSRELSALGEKG